ncbi:MAG: hypothetical protein PUI44_01645 [Firmicutes bacterium]|nr:hypothetical protein [Bacillota bacterium]
MASTFLKKILNHEKRLKNSVNTALSVVIKREADGWMKKKKMESWRNKNDI